MEGLQESSYELVDSASTIIKIIIIPPSTIEEAAETVLDVSVPVFYEQATGKDLYKDLLVDPTIELITGQKQCATIIFHSFLFGLPSYKFNNPGHHP